MSLEQRLKQGPLPIRSLWSEEQTRGIDENVRRIGSQRRRAASALVLMTMCVALVVFQLRRTDSAPSTQSVAAAPQNTEHATPEALAAIAEPRQQQTLTDGSRVTLGGGASFKVLSQSANAIVCDFSGGASVWEVTPNPARKFEVRTGDVTVAVLGTVFSLQRAEGRTHVVVERGVVSVRWPGGSEDLRAGFQGSFPPLATRTSPGGSLAEPAVIPDETGARAQVAPSKDVATSWRQLARAGDYQEAYRAFEPSSIVGADDLMLAADVARSSGHPAEAVPYLKRVQRDFSGSAQAPLAAFTLGRIFADQLGQPASAAQAFKAAYDLNPAGPLASDALAREVESLSRAGDSDQAARRAVRYLELYPQGRHRGEMQRIRSRD